MARKSNQKGSGDTRAYGHTMQTKLLYSMNPRTMGRMIHPTGIWESSFSEASTTRVALDMLPSYGGKKEFTFDYGIASNLIHDRFSHGGERLPTARMLTCVRNHAARSR